MSEKPGFIYGMIQSDGALVTTEAGREGDEMIVASHNFCDATTWFSTSARVTEEVLTDSGDGLTFGTASHTPWIDLVHGKVLWEDDISDSYKIVVTVDNVEKTEDPMYGPTADYSVNYANGTVTFHSSQAGSTVKVSYSYATSSTYILRPKPGKCIVIEDAEIQFSSDLEYNDCIRLAPWGYCIVFAPQYAESNGGPIPDLDLVELTPRVRRYLRHDQILDEARGAYPVIGIVGGPGGSTSERFGYPLIYKTVTELHSEYGMELRISLENDIAFGGERGTVTFYGVYKVESV